MKSRKWQSNFFELPKLSFILLLICILPVISCTKVELSTQNIVEVDGHGLSITSFTQRYYLTTEFSQADVINARMIKQFINNNLLDDLLYLAAGLEDELQKTSDISEELEQLSKELLVGQKGLLGKAVIPAEFKVTEKELQELYNLIQEEYLIQQIVVPTNYQAKLLIEALKDGGDFGDLAREYSIDHRTRESGGKFPNYVTWGQLGQKISAAILSLELDQVSQPLSTFAGVHLIKLLDKRPSNPPPYLEALPMLNSRLQRIKREVFQQHYFDSLYTKYAYYTEEPMAHQIVKIFLGSGQHNKITTEDYRQLFFETVIARWTDGEITVGEYLNSISHPGDISTALPYTVEAVYQSLRELILQELLLAEADSLGLRESTEFRDIYTKKRDQKIIKLYRDTWITDKVSVDDSIMKRYFQDHRDQYKGKTFEEVKNRIKPIIRNDKIQMRKMIMRKSLKKRFQVLYNQTGIDSLVVVFNDMKTLKAQAN